MDTRLSRSEQSEGKGRLLRCYAQLKYWICSPLANTENPAAVADKTEKSSILPANKIELDGR